MGYQEAVTAHMGTLAYLTGRKIEWDHTNRQVVGAEDWPVSIDTVY